MIIILDGLIIFILTTLVVEFFLLFLYLILCTLVLILRRQMLINTNKHFLYESGVIRTVYLLPLLASIFQLITSGIYLLLKFMF